MKHNPIYLIVLALLMLSCTAEIPDNATSAGRAPKIYPEYSDIDVPVNIAPLNFNIDEKGTDYITEFRTAKGESLTVAGKTLDIDIDRWHSLLSSAEGDTVYAHIYVKADGQWRKYDPVKMCVAEAIDPYISYRHIEPLYVNYEILRICQRNLENFDTEDIYNNCAHLDTEGDRQCMNCHAVQDYNRTGNMQMHIRVVNPGTVIVHNGQARKVNLKTEHTIGPGAYCMWHPTQPYIAYSVNDTWQHFHSVDNNKVEVQDAASDLMVYNIDTNTVHIVSDSPTELETFPGWSADGKTLYYSSAAIPLMNREQMANYRMNNYKDIKYNILARHFDPATGQCSEADTLYNAAAEGKSASFARESPDGRWVLFSVGEYGTFHNFHHDADLYIHDKTTGETRPLEAVNSPDTECYHSWSSNGRWIIFSSRRDNGSYTRFYIAHFDKDGRASKPFRLPQRSPQADDMMFKSYNVPEFMVKPVDLSRADLIDIVNTEPIQAKSAVK